MTAHVVLIVYGDRPLPRLEGLEGVAVERLDAPRPGSDTQLYCAPGEPAPAVLAVVSEAEHALRIVVEGPLLATAHGRAAEALEAVAALDAAAQLTATAAGAPLVVVDLFCLDARPIEEAAARLRGDDIASTLLIGVRQHDEAVVDLETFGLRKLGMRELFVPGLPRHLAETVGLFLNDVARYVRARGKVIEPSDAIAFGWVDVRPLAAEGLEAFPDEPSRCAPRFIHEATDAPAELPGMLVLCEPESDEPEAPLRAGLDRAAEIMSVMVASARQCGIDESIDVPRGRQTAVVSKTLSAGGPAELRRVARDEVEASGWVAVALGEDPTTADFEVIPLVGLAIRIPRAFSLLGLPFGSGLTLGADDTLTIHLP